MTNDEPRLTAAEWRALLVEYLERFWDDFVIADGWKMAQAKKQEEATVIRLLAEIRDLLDNGPRDAQ